MRREQPDGQEKLVTLQSKISTVTYPLVGWLVHSISKHLLGTYYVQGTLPGTVEVNILFWAKTVC